MSATPVVNPFEHSKKLITQLLEDEGVWKSVHMVDDGGKKDFLAEESLAKAIPIPEEIIGTEDILEFITNMALGKVGFSTPLNAEEKQRDFFCRIEDGVCIFSRKEALQPGNAIQENLLHQAVDNVRDEFTITPLSETGERHFNFLIPALRGADSIKHVLDWARFFDEKRVELSLEVEGDKTVDIKVERDPEEQRRSWWARRQTFSDISRDVYDILTNGTEEQKFLLEEITLSLIIKGHRGEQMLREVFGYGKGKGRALGGSDEDPDV